MADDKTLSGMSDHDVVGYCEIHCRTDVALFSRGQIEHLVTLANNGTEVRRDWKWASFGPWTIDPLVAAARKNMRP